MRGEVGWHDRFQKNTKYRKHYSWRKRGPNNTISKHYHACAWIRGKQPCHSPASLIYLSGTCEGELRIGRLLSLTPHAETTAIEIPVLVQYSTCPRQEESGNRGPQIYGANFSNTMHLATNLSAGGYTIERVKPLEELLHLWPIVKWQGKF